VVIPDGPAELAVRGGWHIATMVQPAHWEVLSAG
jgi:hypothetical protein